ncbi:MAG: hypothetical protein U1E65_21095 [Myxococcota bacterium]
MLVDAHAFGGEEPLAEFEVELSLLGAELGDPAVDEPPVVVVNSAHVHECSIAWGLEMRGKQGAGRGLRHAV